jgi:hypothetical protein
VAAALLAGACADAPTAAPAPRPARTAAAHETPAGLDAAPLRRLATLRWLDVTRDAIARNRPSQHQAFRTMAYVHLAQHVAVERVVAAGRRPGAGRTAGDVASDTAGDATDASAGADAGAARPDTRVAAEGAVGGAAVEVLAALYPADRALLEAVLAAQHAELPEPDRRAYARGVAAGRATGLRAAQRARQDGFDAPWTGTVPTGPGYWVSATTPPTPPAYPRLGEMRTFHLATAGQFRPGAPPAHTSPEFRAAVAEVRAVADTRTARQDSLARYWAVSSGGLIAGLWNGLLAQRIERARLDERQAAHALALANTAAMDALAACHEAKVVYWTMRPSQADPGIRLAIGLPNYPAYPSNVACFSAAIAGTMGALLPADRARFAALAREAAESRIFGGIHYRFDMDAGLALGARVARVALARDRRHGLGPLLER